MQVEFEATFSNVNKNEMREKLRVLNAHLLRPEFMQKRTVLNQPEGHGVYNGWLRVRDEGDKITIGLKAIVGEGIERQKELEIIVNDYDTAVNLLKSIGCEEKAYQESLRELWELDGVEITIDEWPFLEPFVEIEGKSEEVVKKISDKLGFNYSDAIFDSVDAQYHAKYGVSVDGINQHTPRIVFDMNNPFLDRND